MNNRQLARDIASALLDDLLERLSPPEKGWDVATQEEIKAAWFEIILAALLPTSTPAGRK